MVLGGEGSGKGNVGQEIANYSRTHDIDNVFVGRRDLSRFQRFFEVRKEKGRKEKREKRKEKRKEKREEDIEKREREEKRVVFN